MSEDIFDNDNIKLSGLTLPELEGLIARLPPEDELLEAALEEYDRRTSADTKKLRASLKDAMGIGGKKEGGRRPPIVKTFILLAAALALAGTALAAISRSGMFNALFGTGIVSDGGGGPVTVEPHEYSYDSDGETITYTLPGYRLEAVDEEDARRLIEPYVTDVGRQYTVDGYTFTIISYIRDEAGSERLYYCVENPEGLENASTYDYNGYTCLGSIDGMSGLVGHGSMAYVDTANSTETKLFICVPGTVFHGDFGFAIYGKRPASDDAYIPPEVEFTVDVEKEIPAVTAESSEYSAALSPMGLKLTRFEESAVYFEPEYVSVTLADGEEYVIWDRGRTDNTTYSCGSDTAQIYCFNRLIDPALARAVTVDGEVIPINN